MARHGVKKEKKEQGEQKMACLADPTVGGPTSSSRSRDRGQAGSASGASRPSRQWRQPPMEISRLRRVGGLGFSAMCRTLRLTRSSRVDRPLLRIGGVNLVKQADDDEDVSTETEKMMNEVTGLKGAMLYARRRRIEKSYRRRSGRVHREAEAHKPTQTKEIQRRRQSSNVNTARGL